MNGRARVLVWHRAPAADRTGLEAAYHEVSRALAGTPGLLGNELLQDTVHPDRFAVLSEWESLDAFRTWEAGARHRDTTSPLRAFRDNDRAGGSFGVYEVSLAYRGALVEVPDG